MRKIAKIAIPWNLKSNTKRKKKCIKNINLVSENTLSRFYAGPESYESGAGGSKVQVMHQDRPIGGPSLPRGHGQRAVRFQLHVGREHSFVTYFI